MELVFATNNKHKSIEIDRLLGENRTVKSLPEIGFEGDVPETGKTLEENALQKARYIKTRLGTDCFADDTGLEIDALNGAPGVYSARYAGPEKDSLKNMEKVLRELKDCRNRKARFRTVIALILDNKELLFEGIVNGSILENPRGEKGFGYDPVFLPEGYTLSFAEMSLNEKNKISHRAIAVKKLVDYLKTLNNARL
ncbi:MAG: Nucleoside-triphosphatase rdgB [Anaerophaga sp.]|uniref:non-canonical purine NTP diphosphatase n=1 Tax=Anaerophaga thermohalophila TaxID=177400 RepID=UPI0002E0BF5A|nr:non-canonical purine NTP diphosphatase [Anaerophaga thermohalophila]MBZ4675617.1 Nucleoside-triphosphatase rdgB [Anaerophaga sp.]